MNTRMPGGGYHQEHAFAIDLIRNYSACPKAGDSDSNNLNAQEFPSLNSLMLYDPMNQCIPGSNNLNAQEIPSKDSVFFDGSANQYIPGSNNLNVQELPGLGSVLRGYPSNPDPMLGKASVLHEVVRRASIGHRPSVSRDEKSGTARVERLLIEHEKSCLAELLVANEKQVKKNPDQLKFMARRAAFFELLSKEGPVPVCDFLAQQLRCKTMSSREVMSCLRLQQPWGDKDGEPRTFLYHMMCMPEPQEGKQRAIAMTKLFQRLEVDDALFVLNDDNPLPILFQLIEDEMDAGVRCFSQLMSGIDAHFGAKFSKQVLRKTGPHDCALMDAALFMGNGSVIAALGQVFLSVKTSSGLLAQLLTPSCLGVALKQQKYESFKAYGELIQLIQADGKTKLDKEDAGQLHDVVHKSHMSAGLLFETRTKEYKDMVTQCPGIYKAFKAGKNSLKASNY